MKNSLSGEIVYKLHVAIYAVVLLVSLVMAFGLGRGYYVGYGVAGFMFMALLWGFVFALHTHHYAVRKGYGSARRDERQAYRDGFNDSIRELRNNQSSRIPSRLSIDDYLGEDGELYDEYERDYQKQKRDY